MVLTDMAALLGREGTTEGAKMAEALRAGTFDTVIGRIGFDAKGDLVSPATFVWYIWRDGGYVQLGE